MSNKARLTFTRKSQLSGGFSCSPLSQQLYNTS